MSFRLISVSSVCDGARIVRLGGDKVLKSKFKILIPINEFRASHKLSFSSNCLDFRKISVSRQIWLKIQTPLFLKLFMGFVHHLNWMIIKHFKFQ